MESDCRVRPVCEQYEPKFHILPRTGGFDRFPGLSMRYTPRAPVVARFECAGDIALLGLRQLVVTALGDDLAIGIVVNLLFYQLIARPGL